MVIGVRKNREGYEGGERVNETVPVMYANRTGHSYWGSHYQKDWKLRFS